MLQSFKKTFGGLLEAAVLLLMASLTAIIVVGVYHRKVLDASLSWYDEVASINLIWLTYCGAALAALRRKHIGVDGVVAALPFGARAAAFVIAEIVVLGFVALLTYSGWHIHHALAGETMISLTWVPQQIPQSAVPIGAALFLAAELLSLPDAWRAMAAGASAGHSHDETE